MQIWNILTHNGNQEFTDKNFEFALTSYEQALKQASSMLNLKNETDIENVVSLILISHCNLANCYFELNWIKKACEQYEIAHQFLKAAIVLSQNNKLQLAALKSNKLLKQKWLSSLKKYKQQLPDFNTLRTYSRSMCNAYNIHTFKQIGAQHEYYSNVFNHFSFNG